MGEACGEEPGPEGSVIGVFRPGGGAFQHSRKKREAGGPAWAGPGDEAGEQVQVLVQGWGQRRLGEMALMTARG